MTKICLALIVLIAMACAYDHVEEQLEKEPCPVGGVSFSQSVLPIIMQNCAVLGCHVAGQPRPDFTNYSNIADKAIEIRKRINARTMPPMGSGRMLTQQQIDTLTCWIDEGAKNN